jgi:hypothetical protein
VVSDLVSAIRIPPMALYAMEADAPLSATVRARTPASATWAELRHLAAAAL